MSRSSLFLLVLTLCVCGPQMVAAVSDQFNQLVERVIVIDCRYPYEFEGGHIKVSEARAVCSFPASLRGRVFCSCARWVKPRFGLCLFREP